MSVSDATARTIRQSVRYLQTAYQFAYRGRCEYANLLGEIATQVLEAIARSDAAYHNLEHTLQVALVGQEILQGKHRSEKGISQLNWLHFMISLLCHDIGYIKGICKGDQPEQNRFVTGIADGYVTLPATATGASLTPFHVDRGQQFVAEAFSDHPFIDIQALQRSIERTRFPVPADEDHRLTLDYPGLARAADLLGQLSDPHYLAKIPALFDEFEETGGNKALGYEKPGDLRAGYPKFYWLTVSQYVHHGIRYLEVAPEGKPILENLYHNLSVVEQELMLAAA